MTGSKNVITLNLNRIIQDWSHNDWTKEWKILEGYNSIPAFTSLNKTQIKSYLTTILSRVYKYQEAYNALLHWAYDNHLFDAYSAGFIDLDKQYLTIGINGLNQAAEFMGIDCTDNGDYKEFCQIIFSTIKEQNTLHRTAHTRYNTEQIPAESAAIKLYNRDKKDGYWVPSDTNLYASYIFKPNDERLSPLDKIRMHGSEYIGNYLDGGSACHINLSEHLDKTQYELLLNYAAVVGCSYLTFNVPNSECQKCGYITKVPIDICPACGAKEIALYDRIIGYLTKINNWSKGRQIEQKTRVYS
jgi:ribonucleoside-triphosphate reductase